MRLRTGESEAARVTMGRVAGTLFVAGTALTVVGILLPHSSKADVGGFWALAAGTALGALLLFRYAAGLSLRSYECCMVIASAIITLSIYFNGERHGGPSAGNQVLYLWVALYAAYFFSRRAMARQLVAIGALYGGVLVAIHPGPVALTRWLITVGMVAVAAAIVHALRLRNEDLLARLSDAARIDSLTGLLNRQAFDEQLQAELARGCRTGRPTALIVADIDHFKEINDLCGHAAGDAALRVVGETARRTARRTDYLARIGGDEFAAILPETGGEEAFQFAERLREAISASRPPGEPALTMSLGIAESTQDGLTPEILTRSADTALYEAKKLGRNQTAAAPGAYAASARTAGARLAASPAGLA
jgi:diguanylate cyclase (GGDEF)-like protein